MIKNKLKQLHNYATFSKMGDISLLGQHLIMCGNSTDIEQVKKLMGNEKADLAFTGRPYNINYTGRLLKRKILLMINYQKKNLDTF